MTLRLMFADSTEALSQRASERLSTELPIPSVDEIRGGAAGRIAVVSSGVRPRGDVYLENWDNTLNTLGVRWHKDQMSFLNGVRTNAIPGFYGDEWPAHRERVCRAQNINGEQQPVMFTSPRRWGKTTAMAGAAACYALTVPNSTQAIFSTGKRASQLALQLIYRMVCTHPEWEARVVKFNAETLVLRVNSKDNRVINSYPSNVRVRWVCVHGGWRWKGKR